VTLLPLHSPIKIAEEAAICDILSDGRLEFGVGRGIARHYPSYGIPPEESRGRFDEALDFVLAAWTNETFSFNGRYFPARDLALVPRPVQTASPAGAHRRQQSRHVSTRSRTAAAAIRFAADQSAGQAEGGPCRISR
jgi:alkanesulfonate monooxygenase SsuD/methylene tetrahydromethanopterin reductase-like flavin-dependent oxidoreductase (luciferase family)